MPEKLPLIISLILTAAIFLLLLWRGIRNWLAPVRSVKAQVIGKNTVESFSKTGPGGKRIRYVVIFEAEGKRRSFYVSEFSYRGYRKAERGTLTYKGDRLIGFE